MNQLMTSRTKPYNLEIIFWKITRMMTTYFVVSFTTLLACIWLCDFLILNGVHQSSSGFISIGMLSLSLIVIVLCGYFSFLGRAIFLCGLTIDRLSFFGLSILLDTLLTFLRIVISFPSFNTCRRLVELFHTRFADSKMTILPVFVVVKLIERFTNATPFASFHRHLYNKSSPLARRGLVSMQPRPKGELEYDCITKRLHRQLHYNTLEVNYG